jgi:hypothetical protein
MRFVVIESLGNATMRPAPDAVVRDVLDACTR